MKMIKWPLLLCEDRGRLCFSIAMLLPLPRNQFSPQLRGKAKLCLLQMKVRMKFDHTMHPWDVIQPQGGRRNLGQCWCALLSASFLSLLPVLLPSPALNGWLASSCLILPRSFFFGVWSTHSSCALSLLHSARHVWSLCLSVFTRETIPTGHPRGGRQSSHLGSPGASLPPLTQLSPVIASHAVR